MKKYLMAAISAVFFGTTFTSCSHNLDLYDGGGENKENSQKYTAELMQAEYNAVFETVFGKVGKDVNWGFGSGSASTRAFTRAITVNGDTYNKFPSTSEINSFFPTAIPEGADEVSELLTKYQGTNAQTPWGETTMYDLYAIYSYKIVEGYNLKITSAGTYDVGGCQNIEWVNGKSVYKYYNVYVDVPNNGEVIINRPQDSHFNLYILHGNVKMGPTQASEWSSQAISVGTGATFTDNRDHIAANGGVKLYNRGTVYATNSTKYDIGNFCTVYNEGRFEVTGPLTYSPADANASYFMNHGDNAVLKAPSMTLNSSGNFFNDGNVEIEGATTVTNDGIFWVNAGHYTTGSMTFSAKNTTFYNYCNLICRGNAHMYDGEFNLMDNSYTEAGSAEMDNFVVNMGSNTGMNIKGNFDLLIGQGDGTYQGFRTSGTNDFLRVAGTVTVAGHMYTLELTGDITYAFNNLVDLGANDSGVQPTYRFNTGTKEAQFDKLTVTPNATSCGATWTTDDEPGPTPTVYRVICEDLSASDDTDFDFNDVVFDVYPDTDANGNVLTTGATIKLICAGGIYHLTVAGHEVHKEFDPSQEGAANGEYLMINTGRNKIDNEPEFHIGVDCSTPEKINENIQIYVTKVDPDTGDDLRPAELKAEIGAPAAKVLVDQTFTPLKERESIKKKRPKFKAYVNGTLRDEKWWSDED